MFQRLSIVALFWTLFCASASGQESSALPDPMNPYSRATQGVAGAEPALKFRVSGTLISPSGRVAIVNGRASREGDRVGGAEILSIDAGVVRIHTGSQELTVHLGSNAVRGRSSSPTPQVSRELTRLESPPQRPAGSMLSEAPTVAQLDTPGHHGPVKRGETLSGIAQHYRGDGVTMNQMMLGLFQANPQAFSGNINVLHEGALLRIPDGNELHDQPPEIATAEVARHQTDWLDTGRELDGPAPDQGRYGPVNSGETLSGIAQHYRSDGVTMDQMMIALFRANPHAFSGNINVLHEGAVLRIPDGNELRSQPPGTATAEVVRQTDAWRTGSRQQARLTMPPVPDGVEAHILHEGSEVFDIPRGRA